MTRTQGHSKDQQGSGLSLLLLSQEGPVREARALVLRDATVALGLEIALLLLECSDPIHRRVSRCLEESAGSCDRVIIGRHLIVAGRRLTINSSNTNNALRMREH